MGGEDRPIVRLSRETNSGTHVYFLETVIRLGDDEDTDIFSADTLLLPSSEGIISEVSGNPNAIGYDGLGYITDEVKTVALASKAGRDLYPTLSRRRSSTAPTLFPADCICTHAANRKASSKITWHWILSDEAQEIVTELGFVPILK